MAKAPTSTPATDAAPATETKAERFKRLGNARLGKALDAIANLRGLANTTNYEYTPDQVKAIFTALEAEMGKLQETFNAPAAATAKPALSIL